MVAGQESATPLLSVRGILIGVICIVVATLLLEGLRHVVELPFSDSLESMIATGLAVVVWFAIVFRVKR